MKRTAPKLKKLYARLNRKYFGGVLPTDTVTGWCPNLKWSGSIGICYYTTPFQLDIARELKKYPRLTESTLIHEMNHIYCWVKHGPDGLGHGKKFQAGMMRLARLGALKRLW